MVREAEAHAEEDRRKKQLAEAKNEADNMIYTVEKTLIEMGDKISDDEKKRIQEALEKCRQIKDTSSDINEIKICYRRTCEGFTQNRRGAL